MCAEKAKKTYASKLGVVPSQQLFFTTLDYLRMSNVSFEVNRFSDSWKIKNQIDKPWVLEESDRGSIFSLPLAITAADDSCDCAYDYRDARAGDK